jgi:Tfp pilus assembly protein PilF
MTRARISKAAAAALVVASLAAAPALGQAWAGRGRAQGTVKDESGKPVVGAKITLRPGGGPVDAKADGPESMTTDAKGRWSILGLDGGPWSVLIEKEGFIPSEGQIQVSEFGPAPPVNVTLKVIPKEVIEQAQKKAEQESVTGQAKAALQRGNDLLAAARAGGSPDKAKLGQARTAYEEGLAKLAAAKLETPEQQQAVADTRLSVLQALAGIDYELGETDKAVGRLKEVLASKPDDVGVLQLLIDILVGTGKEEEAKQYMAKLPAGTKMDANTVLNMGIKAFNDGNMDKAFEAFDRAIKENPDRADAYYYRALVYINRNKHPEAKADLQKLLALDPNGKFADDAKAFLKDLK